MVLNTLSLNPYTYISMHDDTGDALHSFLIVSCPVNQHIESYWSTFFCRQICLVEFNFSGCGRMWKNLIQVNPLYWFLPGFILWIFYEKNLQTLQMNGIAICFRQTEWAQHLLGLTLSTSYHIFMELQTTWSVMTLQAPTNLLVLPALYTLWLLRWLWWVAETLVNENNIEVPHDASSAFDLHIYFLSKIEEYS